ncbi:sugar phosphate isomerase/epimerase family protein [Streptomyces sp. NPDC057099]|uniref:sugar phosphate isomerase/epimerase family protein n=1 Tax=Streptomyces sp. NPDC057099 TaxID=3346019 RepID=UPI00363C2809
MELGCVVRSAEEAEHAAGLAFDYGEVKGDMLCVPRDDLPALTARLQRTGLPFKAMTSPLPRRYGCRVVGPDADHARALSVFRDMCDRGAALGVGTVVLGSGQARDVPRGFPTEEAGRQFRDFLVAARDVCAERAMTVALEHLNSTETNLVNSCTEARTVVEAVDGAGVRITADCFHLVSEGLHVRTEVAAAGSAIAHAHTSAVPRGSGDFREETQREFVTALLAAGHDGGLTVEDEFADFGREAAEAAGLFHRILGSTAAPS